MDLCVICNNEFKKNSASNSCSLKCRIKEWAHTDENGCWIWKGARGGDYGKTSWKKKIISSHRASYLAYKGDIPKKMNVCHRCDVKLCVNPDHLWLGTTKENMQDAKSKNRLPDQRGRKHSIETLEKLKLRRRPDKRGEKHHLCKLSELDVLEIRKKIDLGQKQKEIAVEYGLNPSTVSYIKNRRLWPHL